MSLQARGETIKSAGASAGPSSLQERGHSRAVIVGGSIAGLSAAAALSPFFENVTVIERDDIDGNEV